MAGIVRQQPVSAPRIFSFRDLEQQGQEIVARAQAQAAELLETTRRRAATLAEEQAKAARAAAHREGLAAGREEGLKEIRATAHAQAVKEAHEQIDSLVRALTAMLADFEQNKRRLIAAAESGLIDLALAVARRVRKLEAGTSSAVAVANARHLLEMVQHERDAELRVNPAEADAIRSVAAELTASVEQLGHVKIVADESVARGGCVLAMREGEVDAGLETQLERIASALRVDGGSSK